MRHDASSMAQTKWGLTLPSPTRTRPKFQAVGRHAYVVAAFVAADLLAVVTSAGAGVLLAPSAPLDWPKSCLLLCCAVIPLHAAIGLYGRWTTCPIARLRLRALGSAALAATTLIAIAVWTSNAQPKWISSVFIMLFLLGHYMEGQARDYLMKKGVWGAPTILIGAHDQCTQIADTLLSNPKLGLRPVGIATDFPDSADIKSLVLPILSAVSDIDQLNGVGEVAIVTASHLAAAGKMDALRVSQLPFAHAIVAESIHTMPNFGLRTRNLGNALGLELRFDLFRPGYLALKRLLDLAIAIPALIVLSPLLASLACLVKFVDAGPSFYRQRRAGRDGQVLEMLKLRTMYCDAEERLRQHLRDNPEARAEWERFFKLKSDPRVLPRIGNFLRRSSLDELPQLWNIVRGDMSIVGPRPFPEYHVKSFDTAFQKLRGSVPPGLTGMWQVGARSNGDLEVQKDQDLFYIRNWSIWLDIYIIVETVPAVLSARGAR